MIEDGVRLSNCVIMRGVHVKKHSKVRVRDSCATACGARPPHERGDRRIAAEQGYGVQVSKPRVPCRPASLGRADCQVGLSGVPIEVWLFDVVVSAPRPQYAAPL